MREIAVAIIGAGQRGISTLERISALYPEYHNPLNITVHVIDPGIFGQGAHGSQQPSHLITNTTIVQTTVFVDSSVENAGPPRVGPSYAEWLWLSGYRWNGEIVLGEGDKIPDDTYTPRALLGRYLEWCFDHICSTLPKYLIVEKHKATAEGIQRVGDAFRIDLQSGRHINADYVFVTTGHSSGDISEADKNIMSKIEKAKIRNSLVNFIPSASHFRQLDEVSSKARILICGTGLTAADAISILTVGRGGGFEQARNRRLKYIKSGKEPKLTLYSRQGLPSGAKGVNQKEIGRNYKPTCFTYEYVEKQRLNKEALDWERDLQPCLVSEIEACYAATLAKAFGEDILPPGGNSVGSLVSALLHPWHGKQVRSPAEHRSLLIQYLADDIDAAFRGNRSDPTKAVSEMLRDLNDVVRYAVDYGGLSEASHRSFLNDWVSINNRVAAGPPKERNMELLALMEAGVLEIFEPNPDVEFDEMTACFTAVSKVFDYEHTKSFDVLIRARVASFNVTLSPSPFFASGHSNGIFTPFRNGSFLPGGIAIDQNLNVVGAEGRPLKNIWAMGYAVEGAHYYTYVLPCPLSNSRSLRDAATAVRAMLSRASSQAAVAVSAAEVLSA